MSREEREKRENKVLLDLQVRRNYFVLTQREREREESCFCVTYTKREGHFDDAAKWKREPGLANATMRGLGTDLRSQRMANATRKGLGIEFVATEME